MKPLLAYVEHCLPAADPAGRRELARRHGLALEVANRAGADLDGLRGAGIIVATVQAWEMHRIHPLHPDPEARRSARRHLEETVRAARRLGASRVLAVCGYGPATPGDPLERCVEFFAPLAPLARDAGVRLLIEPLSRLRAAAMTGPAAVGRLLDALGDPRAFGAALDTGHLLDDGDDPAECLAGWRRSLAELQIRGVGSAPPAPDVPLGAWLAALPSPPEVVAVEHGARIAPQALAALVAALRAALPE